mmetsp:Transcript_10122/g.25725  ORF Transcript_10122/g.25725 Transcript_10122/m.25725 type:complete len:201 (+) Transcript_10122:384-986(+)
MTYVDSCHVRNAIHVMRMVCLTWRISLTTKIAGNGIRNVQHAYQSHKSQARKTVPFWTPTTQLHFAPTWRRLQRRRGGAVCAVQSLPVNRRFHLASKPFTKTSLTISSARWRRMTGVASSCPKRSNHRTLSLRGCYVNCLRSLKDVRSILDSLTGRQFDCVRCSSSIGEHWLQENSMLLRRTRRRQNVCARPRLPFTRLV